MVTENLDIVRHLEPLRQYARVLTGRADTADDLVHATFLRAYERLGSYRQGTDIRFWLMAICHNLFIDMRRKEAADKTRERNWSDLQSGFVAPSGEFAARLNQVLAAFLVLPEDRREALYLVAIEGLSVAEPSDLLGVPPGTIMSRVARAREALRAFEDGQRTDKTKPALKIVGDGGEQRK